MTYLPILSDEAEDFVREEIQTSICDADYCLLHGWARRWREELSIWDIMQMTQTFTVKQL